MEALGFQREFPRIGPENVLGLEVNPSDLVRAEPEVVPGYHDRVIARDEAAAAVLVKRTLTNLYNTRPAWLANAHAKLDSAVAAAYGWSANISTDEALERLLAQNLKRAAKAYVVVTI